jgi:hypothetical protein
MAVQSRLGVRDVRGGCGPGINACNDGKSAPRPQAGGPVPRIRVAAGADGSVDRADLVFAHGDTLVGQSSVSILDLPPPAN